MPHTAKLCACFDEVGKRESTRSVSESRRRVDERKAELTVQHPKRALGEALDDSVKDNGALVEEVVFLALPSAHCVRRNSVSLSSSSTSPSSRLL